MLGSSLRFFNVVSAHCLDTGKVGKLEEGNFTLSYVFYSTQTTTITQHQLQDSLQMTVAFLGLNSWFMCRLLVFGKGRVGQLEVDCFSSSSICLLGLSSSFANFLSNSSFSLSACASFSRMLRKSVSKLCKRIAMSASTARS